MRCGWGCLRARGGPACAAASHLTITRRRSAEVIPPGPAPAAPRARGSCTEPRQNPRPSHELRLPTASTFQVPARSHTTPAGVEAGTGSLLPTRAPYYWERAARSPAPRSSSGVGDLAISRAARRRIGSVVGMMRGESQLPQSRSCHSGLYFPASLHVERERSLPPHRAMGTA